MHSINQVDALWLKGLGICTCNDASCQAKLSAAYANKKGNSLSILAALKDLNLNHLIMKSKTLRKKHCWDILELSVPCICWAYCC